MLVCTAKSLIDFKREKTLIREADSMSDFASWKPSRRSSVFIRDLTRIKNLEIFILGVVLLLIAFVRFNPRFEYQWDDSSYIIAAKAYLHGQGFVYANDPRMPPAIERPRRSGAAAAGRGLPASCPNLSGGRPPPAPW